MRAAGAARRARRKRASGRAPETDHRLFQRRRSRTLLHALREFARGGSIQGPQRVRPLSRVADRLALPRPAVASWPAPADGVEADRVDAGGDAEFSRGAIIACVASLILLLGLTFATASSSSER